MKDPPSQREATTRKLCFDDDAAFAPLSCSAIGWFPRDGEVLINVSDAAHRLARTKLLRDGTFTPFTERTSTTNCNT